MRGEEGELEVAVLLPLLSTWPARGDEEVDRRGSTALAPMLCLREILEISLPMAFPKQWPHFVTTIHDQMGGHAMLSADSFASFFFLQVRIFYSFDPALKPSVQPSDFVLGWS
jgi:hypothetical protein